MLTPCICGTDHNHQIVESAYVSTKRQMDKENVIHICVHMYIYI